jgi:hypothetical protein
LKYLDKIFLGLVFLLIVSCGFFGKSTVWEKSVSTKDAPEPFSFLMFPKNERVELMDEKGRKTGLFLNRGLVVTQSEIIKRIVGVDFDDKKYSVRLEELTPIPKPETEKVLIENWKIERSKRGEKVDFSYKKMADGKSSVFLVINSPTDIDFFTYTIDGENLIPEKWEMDRSRHMAN